MPIDREEAEKAASRAENTAQELASGRFSSPGGGLAVEWSGNGGLPLDD